VGIRRYRVSPVPTRGVQEVHRIRAQKDEGKHSQFFWDQAQNYQCKPVVSTIIILFVDLSMTADSDYQWRLVVKLAGRAARIHFWLNIWDCRPGCFHN